MSEIGSPVAVAAPRGRGSRAALSIGVNRSALIARTATDANTVRLLMEVLPGLESMGRGGSARVHRLCQRSASCRRIQPLASTQKRGITARIRGKRATEPMLSLPVWDVKQEVQMLRQHKDAGSQGQEQEGLRRVPGSARARHALHDAQQTRGLRADEPVAGSPPSVLSLKRTLSHCSYWGHSLIA